MTQLDTPPTMGGTVANMTHTENSYTADDYSYLTIPGVLLDTETGIEYGIDEDQGGTFAGEVLIVSSCREHVEIVEHDVLRTSDRWTAVRRDDAPRVSLATAAERLRRSGQ